MGAVGGAASYGIQVSTVSTFAANVADQAGLTVTSLSNIKLNNNTLYFWRANAVNATTTSAWSSVWSFTTVVSAPPPPTLMSPENGTANLPITSLTLRWGSVAGATSYAVQASLVSTFATTVASQGGFTATTLIGGSGILTYNTTYFWRVNASNAGGSSSWAALWSFSTVPLPPPMPTLSTPSNGQIMKTTALTLRWNTVTGATYYGVQVSTSSIYANTLPGDGCRQQRTLTGMTRQTTYYWTVRAANAGGSSSWTATWSFINADVAALPVQHIALTAPELSVTANALHFSVPREMLGEIVFYDMRGRMAYSSKEMLAAGSHTLAFTRCNLSAGKYVVRFKAGDVEKRLTVTLSR